MGPGFAAGLPSAHWPALGTPAGERRQRMGGWWARCGTDTQVHHTRLHGYRGKHTSRQRVCRCVCGSARGYHVRLPRFRPTNGQRRTSSACQEEQEGGTTHMSQCWGRRRVAHKRQSTATLQADDSGSRVGKQTGGRVSVRKGVWGGRRRQGGLRGDAHLKRPVPKPKRISPKVTCNPHAMEYSTDHHIGA